MMGRRPTSSMLPASEGILSTGPLDGSASDVVGYANQITQKAGRHVEAGKSPPLAY